MVSQKDSINLFGPVLKFLSFCHLKWLSKKGTKYFSKTTCNKAYQKKDRDKRFIKNCRPISLLNVEVKLISKYYQTESKTIAEFDFI